MSDDAKEGQGGAASSQRFRWLGLGENLGDSDQAEGGVYTHVFRIRERWFIVPSDLTAEVSTPLHCARLPFTQPWFLGLVNFRGELVPVYDLHAMLEGVAAASDGYFLILGPRDARAAFRIDEITMVEVSSGARVREQCPLSNLPDGIQCRGLEIDGRTYAELDLAGLMALLAERAGLLSGGTLSR